MALTVTAKKVNNEKCVKCKLVKTIDFEFLSNPPWLFIQAKKQDVIYANQLPKLLTIKNKSYRLLCATIFSKNHFRSIFYLNSTFLLFDDLKNEIINQMPKIKIVTCFYYLSE